MLSKDFASPQIKNKMSKREFIRNTRRAAPAADTDLLGHLYDNVYVEGNIATWITVTADTAGSPPGSPPGPRRRRVVGPGQAPPNRPYRVIEVANS